MDLILELKKEGAAMVGVFHDEIAIRTLADQRFEMKEKRLVPVDYAAHYGEEFLDETAN